jgi:GNAT superfamily N-acetyltransferase
MKAVTAHSETLALVELDGALAQKGFVLSMEIGWNQSQEDWTYMLKVGEGFGWEAPDGSLAATALALPYGRFAWICMVLVAEGFRRHGLATHLMAKIIERQSAAGRVSGLDATPEGRAVYRRIGFQDHYGLARYRAAPPHPTLAQAECSTKIRPLAKTDLAAMAAYDRRIFGGNRSTLLRYMLDGQPRRAFGAWDGGELSGFVLARGGRHATQIGPLVATDAAIAMALAKAALRGIDGAVFIDALDRHAPFLAWLESSGFEYQRPFARMYLGRETGFDRPRQIYAIAGPELG